MDDTTTIVSEDLPVGFLNTSGFVSKKTRPAKNQKAHVKYLKKRRNKINNHRTQGELPQYNQIGEVVQEIVSHLSSNYKPKGQMWITDYKDIPLAKSTILSYKKGCNMLSHIRYGKNIDGCILVDGVKVVGVVSIERKNNDQYWLQALEITKDYRGYGLSKQLLNLAVKHYGARYLSVNKNNEVAIKLYKDYGFEIYEESGDMYFMKLSDEVYPFHECTLLEAVGRNTKPIFIVNSYTNTPFGKIIKVATQSKYTHSAIAFDTSLETLYSFNGDNKKNVFGGVSIESLSGYINYYNDCLINVRCIFVKDTDYEIIKKVLNHMVQHQDQTTYDFLNIFNILFGRVKEMSNDAMSMVCSQFVTYILSRADIQLIDKSANLTTPKDLVTTNNPKVYLLYDGLGKEYDQKKIDRMFRKLKQKALLIKECSLY